MGGHAYHLHSWRRARGDASSFLHSMRRQRVADCAIMGCDDEAIFSCSLAALLLTGISSPCMELRRAPPLVQQRGGATARSCRDAAAVRRRRRARAAALSAGCNRQQRV